MNTGNIVEFLKTYPDNRLAALRAHTEDGKLAYVSCCCLLGVLNAPHALRGEIPELRTGAPLTLPDSLHHVKIRYGSHSMMASAAEWEFHELGSTDAERRERLLPLILAEQRRREGVAQESAARESMEQEFESWAVVLEAAMRE